MMSIFENLYRGVKEGGKRGSEEVKKKIYNFRCISISFLK